MHAQKCRVLAQRTEPGHGLWVFSSKRVRFMCLNKEVGFCGAVLKLKCTIVLFKSSGRSFNIDLSWGWVYIYDVRILLLTMQEC